MSNLGHFIFANLLLCILFVLVILIYFGYEIRQAKLGRFQISVQDAINLINREKGLFLDVRDKKLYNESRIIGAIHGDIAEIKSNADTLNKFKHHPIVIYCATGSQSIDIYNFLKKKGFDKLYALKGGFKQWLQEKLPVMTTMHNTELVTEKKDKKDKKEK